MSKLFFNLYTFTLESFSKEFLSLNFKYDVKYYVSLTTSSDEKLLPTIPFTYRDNMNKEELCQMLFNHLFTNISYLEFIFKRIF